MGDYFGFYGEMDAYEARMEDMEMEDTMLDDEEDYDDEEEWEDYDNEDIYDHDEYTDWPDRQGNQAYTPLMGDVCVGMYSSEHELDVNPYVVRTQGEPAPPDSS